MGTAALVLKTANFIYSPAQLGHREDLTLRMPKADLVRLTARL